jgi:hypothetical protein
LLCLAQQAAACCRGGGHPQRQPEQNDTFK